MEILNKQQKKLIDFLLENDNYIIAGHESPDGDALGAAYGLYCILKRLGKDVHIRNNDEAPAKLTFFDNDKCIKSWNDSPLSKDYLMKSHLLIVDTNDLENIGLLGKDYHKYFKGTFIIDHHEHPLPHCDFQLIDSAASSTSEMIFYLAEKMNISLPLEAAKGLFLGIMYDTGSFIYPKTSAKTFYAAEQLLKRGVIPYEVYTVLWESNTIAFLKLQSKVLSTLQLLYNNRVSLLVMTKEDLLSCSAQFNEADHLINIPLKSRDIIISVFFKENEEGLLRCSLRSKGNVNVADIAQSFGGGGHKNAAGFKCNHPLDEIKQKVLDSVSLLLD
ncbi:DHH family phosphoesterase [Spirochaeta cellobiosiphila]|uniref:DHH family phosphoesterase n=1 Tax=Spirochaeta cellobiosiphila TaxID=504483 RepID=UPI0004157D53|nr:bifunctional oligoribonuclease/PAP phosphatase NrnA [Spirochaeta cellobiosiphila]